MPSIPPILLILIPAILMAVSVVREKELGSIINFYVTPTTRLEFLLGKQLPYIAIGMMNYVILMFMAIVVFQVPLKGSGLTLTLCALLYVTATTGHRPAGLDLHAQPGGRGLRHGDPDDPADDPVLRDCSSRSRPWKGGRALVGSLWPTTYYMHASVGAFTKALGPRLLAGDVLALALFIPVLTVLTAAALKRQES